MPLRRRLCHEANLSSRRFTYNGVWITDDVLCDAFNRFLRFSNGAKRYGSNVPGPLEAQRRLAKRRMMALAGAGAAPVVDPIALFRMGGPKLGKMRWQPPMQKEETDRGSTTDASWLERLGLKVTQNAAPAPVASAELAVLEQSNPVHKALSDPSGLTTWLDIRSRLKKATVGQMGELASLAQANGLDHIEFCKRAFRSLLWDRKLRWEHVLEFLLNPQLNMPEARHLTYLTSQFGSRLLTPVEFEAGKRLIEGSLKLGLVSDEEIPELINTAFDAAIARALSVTTDRNVISTAHPPESLIDAIWKGLKACRIKSIPTGVAQLILEKLPRGKSLYAFRMELYQHGYPIEGNVDGTMRMEKCLAWWAIQAFSLTSTNAMNYNVLTKIIEDLYPNLVTEEIIVRATNVLLEKLMRVGTGAADDWDTVLNGWLICLHKALAYRIWSPALEVIATKDISPLDLTEFFSQLAPRHLICEALLRYWLPRLPVPPTFAALKQQSLKYEDTNEAHQSSQVASAAAWTGVLQEYRFLHQNRHRNSPYPHDAFTYLLITLHRRHRITLVNQQLLLSLCERLFDARVVSQICEHARAAGVYFYPVPMAEMISRLAKQQPRVALSLFKSRMIYIHRVPELLPALIEDGAHSLEIFRILNQRDPRHLAPVEDRTTFTNAMTKERIDLLHDCADAFSKQEQYSPRTRFRNVYLCYRHLSSRGAPIYPLMSRALVRAGITNFLAAGINIGNTQVKWVLDVVEAVEGHEIAQELDMLVWRWIQKVYAAWNRHQGGMKRPRVPLTHVRFRRSSSGLLKGVRSWAWEMDHAKIPRRIRWYLDIGKWTFTNLDAVFHKRLRNKFRRLLRPPERKEEAEKTSCETSWEPAKEKTFVPSKSQMVLTSRQQPHGRTKP